MELNVRIAGAAGQGLATSSDMLGRVASRAGIYCFSFNDAESRIRGGCNFNHMRFSTHKISAPTDKIDILVALSKEAVTNFTPLLGEKSLFISLFPNEKIKDSFVDLNELIDGNKMSSGIVASSIMSSVMGIPFEFMQEIINDKFKNKTNVLSESLKLAKKGHEFGESLYPGFKFYESDREPSLFLSGGDALSLGVVSGGVSFMSAYPMSPATSIMTNLAGWDLSDVHMEQAEDEISAINMVAGAAYGGARALTATSGGGFALMTEGISLLGMIETPAVIIIAQRPGPATGLPTRTAQGDLRLAIHAGHGFFPKIVLAPKNVAGNFDIGAKAFDLAEKYQVPVIILTDQQLQDTKESCEVFVPHQIPAKRYLLSEEELKEKKEYRRYEITKDGISPMAIPGISEHLVVVDSDEHDEEGHLTESAEIANKMAEKRFAKLSTILADSWQPATAGEGDIAVLTWGSSFEVVKEASTILHEEGCDSFKHINLEWLWPLDDKKLTDLLKQFNRRIVVEHSVYPEFETVIRETTLLDIHHSIRKYDGRPFTVEEIVKQLREVLNA